ncbi:delta-1-pyrroline-5-carboxylate dehydrogenase [Homoserinimonas aerilata]|uniref:L-glutamate gamma-semialdehyde dehydrogenase n=1 Tax=Homoserinimonas aerilata TaxID=1162970 RepID=A0A542YA28_9MICO|nr:L-glutamate gamma-semialdehyde dehydrogenase [Homoserinimonas aerilata]TQL44960.1 delta-1-pyrroline-5-carboxylate dehydrogenase [Homoserinimonas aerilata]
MFDGITAAPTPVNEPVFPHAPGSPERAELDGAIAEMAATRHEFAMTIGGEQRRGAGEVVDVVQPHDRASVLGTVAAATHDDAQAAIDAATAAAPAWAALPFDERAAVMLRAADKLSTTWRARMNAATMLGQSKTIQQSEIDAVAELADFFRFNVHFAQQIMAQQPISPNGQWNRMDYRPLDGFVYAITPFNFTSIAGNLPTAPALMGNTVIWKPSITQSLSAEVTMRLLEESGMPPGVINLVTGHGKAISDVVLDDPGLAGIHFTGSTAVFQSLWSQVGQNISRYRSYPRLVGETGGKDFIVAHPSADVERLRTAIVRGAFEFQGQKCSAASRLYVARSVWALLKDDLVAEVRDIAMGSPLDYGNFMGAVIDDRAYARVSAAIERAKANPKATIIAGGGHDDSVGYFIEPTIVECTDPDDELFTTEFFGPLLGVYVYDDADFDTVLRMVDTASPYALTGAIFATDRGVIERMSDALRQTAGNFYVNDRPTGAVVGQQPFGGSRASGTNDKAGSLFNMVRWTSPRAVKETFNAPTDYRYPHMR